MNKTLPSTLEEVLNDKCLPEHFIKSVKALLEIILSAQQLEPEVAEAIYRAYIFYSNYCRLTSTIITRDRFPVNKAIPNCHDVEEHFQ